MHGFKKPPIRAPLLRGESLAREWAQWFQEVWEYLTTPCVSLINRTGAASVKGQVVAVSTAYDTAFMTAPANSEMAVGVVLEGDSPNGRACRVAVSGPARVLLKDGTAATRGNWVMVSDVVGRADATNAAPTSNHMRGLGKCLESKTAGTDVLCTVLLQKQ